MRSLKERLAERYEPQYKRNKKKTYWWFVITLICTLAATWLPIEMLFQPNHSWSWYVVWIAFGMAAGLTAYHANKYYNILSKPLYERITKQEYFAELERLLDNNEEAIRLAFTRLLGNPILAQRLIKGMDLRAYGFQSIGVQSFNEFSYPCKSYTMPRVWISDLVTMNISFTCEIIPYAVPRSGDHDMIRICITTKDIIPLQSHATYEAYERILKATMPCDVSVKKQ